MPTPIASDIQGSHPYFLGVDEPQDFASSARWKVLAENNPRKAVLQAKFGEGQVLTMRVASTAAPKTTGNRASFPLSSVQTAEWVAHKEHVKLLVTHTGVPASRTLTVDYTASGVTLLTDGKGGIDILAGATRVGALPRPWFEYNVGGDPEARTRVFLDWATGVGSLSITMPELPAAEWQGAVLDPTVITTSTVATATAYSNQRKIDRCQNDVVWAMYWDGTSNTTSSMHFRYSTDNGATWTDGGGFGFAGTGTTYVPNGSFFIAYDSATGDERAVVVYKDRHNGFLHFRTATPNAGRTSWTWSSATAVIANANYDYPDIIAHREGTGWLAHIVCSYQSSTTNRAHYAPLTISSAGAVSVGSVVTLGGSYSAAVHTYPSIDFNHTGDGKSAAGGTPHLYTAWSAGATGAGKGVRYKKAAYSAGSWTWSAEREIDNARYISVADFWLNCLFDGTRVIMSAFLQQSSDSTNDLRVYERDAADTTTTVRVLADDVATAERLYWGSSSYDSAGNIYVFGTNSDEASGSRDLIYRKWTRSSATLGAEVVVDSGVSSPWVSAKRGHSNSRIEFIYTDGTASPYSVTYDSISLAQSVAVNPAVETDTARPLTRVKKRAIVRATETSTAIAVGKKKYLAIGVAAETDFANTISKGVRISMGWATEADTAVSIGITYTPVYYTFTPPTVAQYVGGDRLFSRYSIPVGQTVIKVDGVYEVRPYPWLGDLEGLTDGVDYFLGGHVYTVDNTVANELMEAGYTLDRVS